MKNAHDNSEKRISQNCIANTRFDAFVSDELLPRIGLTRNAFDNLLSGLTNPGVEDQRKQALPALQAASGSQQGIHWGSLYSALYQEDAIPHCAGLRAGEKVNPARTRRVTSSVKDFLDIAFPLTDGSHHDVTSYMVYFQNLMMILADGSTAGLQNPAQFVAKIGPRDNPESILLLQNGLHVELAFDSCGAIGSSDLASINDVQIEIVKSTRSDLTAESVRSKVNQYRKLMETAFSGTNSEAPLVNSDSAEFSAKSGGQYNVSESGHVVYVDSTPFDVPLVTDEHGNPASSQLVDTLIASLIATGANRVRRDDSAEAGPRLIVASYHSAETLRVLNMVEKACRQSRIRPRTPANKKSSDNSSVSQTSADTRAEQNMLTDRGQPVIHRHCPVNNNEKATSAEANSINQAVLRALHHHGFELANLSRGLPGKRLGDQQQLQSGAYA